MKNSRRFKKVASLATAALMAACMAAPITAIQASAVSVKFTNSASDTAHAMSAYQIFKGTVAKSATGRGASAEVKDTQWADGVTSADVITAVNTVLSSEKQLASTASAAEVAKALSDTSLDANAVAKALAKVKTSLKAVSDSSTITEDGYYLFVDGYKGTTDSKDATSLYLLAVIDADATEALDITLKNSAPEVIKKVKEDDKTVNAEGQAFAGEDNYDVGEKFNDVADYCIGEPIDFKLYGTLPSTYDDYTVYYYEFSDTSAATLAIDESTIKVFNGANDITSNFEVSLSGGSLSVKCADIKKVDGVTANSVITVEYQAKLTADAVIGLDGQENEVKLIYSTNPNFKGEGDTDEKDEHGETPKDKVIVFTYELDTLKVDGSTEAPLPGAKFKLGNGTQWAKVENDKFVEWTTEDKATELVSDANGLFKVIGLDSGEYQLKETEAPAGYNTPTDPFTVTLTASTVNDQTWTNKTAADALTAMAVKVGDVAGTVLAEDSTLNRGANGGGQVKIANNSGATLPSTGGMGTTLFYIGGGVLAAGAGVLLITKKRTKKD
ncbi:MAG: isopeptide-forming domain-containing fimbrial protein [Ruminococcus sp.]|nr:isopeptide-forming domain-containing fimbrial protein [Ruminococcus sp.]